MKKIMVISNECFLKLANCFTDNDELKTFITQMEASMREMSFLSMLRDRVEDDEGPVALMQQVAVFSLFCREHTELIHQLIRNLDGKEMTEDEVKEMMDGHDELS